MTAGAALLAAVTVLTLAFPLLAQGYAANVVDNAVLPTGSTSESAPNPEAETSSTSQFDNNLPLDMGIRSLPLLSDWAVQQWETGDFDAAVQTTGERVFGSTWIDLWAIPSTSDWWGVPAHPSEAIPGLASAVKALNSESEQDLLDLAGLLVFEAAFTSSDYSLFDEHQRASVYAVAVAEEAAARFDSCDSRLTAAYIHGLVQQANTNQVIELYDNVIKRCPDDPTAAIEQARSKLIRGDSNRGLPGVQLLTWVSLADNGDWAAVEQTLTELIAAWPRVAAAHALVGDAYLLLARRAPVGQFSLAHFREQAVAAYTAATEISSEPALRLSLAQAQFIAGRLDGVEATLAALPSTANQKQAQTLAAALTASRKDFTRALALTDSAAGVKTPSAPSLELNPSYMYYDPLSFVTVATGGAFGFISNAYPGGASSQVDDLGFTPITRADPSYENPRLAPITDGATDRAMLGYALLAEDWSSADQICQLHSLDYYYLNICGVTAARGRVTDMSVAAADTLQDLMRQWNQLDLATAWNEAWVESSPDEPVAWERLGEVKFLQSDWIGAAEACAQANNLYNTYTSGPAERDQPNNRLENWSNGRLRNMSGPGWALLRQASAERQQDHWKSATALLDLVSQAQVPFDSQWPAGFEHFSQDDAQLLNMYVEMERGQLASDQADHQETIARMEASIALRDSFWQPVVTGAQEQAISLAYFKLGDYQAALDWAEQALAADPFSPLYQEAVADARRALGQATPSSADPTAEPAGVTTNPETTPDEADPGSDRSELIAAYRQSLDLDPSLFSSWNNLGVLLAQDGQAAAAAQAFQQAVRLLPDYAIAWFNLGALEADQPGLGAFLLSQGALGRAGALDSGWKNQDPELSFDNEVYASGLDVSKPIPADWQLAQTVRANTPVVTAGLVFVLLLRVGKELSQSLFTERLAQRSLKRGAHPRLSALTRLRRPAAITSLVSAAALLWVVGPNGWRETVLVGLGAVVLLGWHAFAPRLLAAGRDAGHQAFPLASLLTLGLAPFGLGFTPPAPLAADHAPAAVRRSGIAALTVLTLALAALAAVTAVPATRATALAGVLVLSSALIPFPPLDGGRLQTKRRTELAISLLLLVATIAVALKLI